MIKHRLERLAIWYLKRRGICVLPRMWRGLAIGGPGCVAYSENYDRDADSRFEVILPPRSQLVVMNHSMVDYNRGKL